MICRYCGSAMMIVNKTVRNEFVQFFCDCGSRVSHIEDKDIFFPSPLQLPRNHNINLSMHLTIPYYYLN